MTSLHKLTLMDLLKRLPEDLARDIRSVALPGANIDIANDKAVVDAIKLVEKIVRYGQEERENGERAFQGRAVSETVVRPAITHAMVAELVTKAFHAGVEVGRISEQERQKMSESAKDRFDRSLTDRLDAVRRAFEDNGGSKAGVIKSVLGD